MNGSMNPLVERDDETNITEITIQPDGRIYVFGLSRQVLQILENLHPGEAHLTQLLTRVRGVESTAVESKSPP